MKVKLVTAILLILCGVGIGWLAFENLMWAVWGKQNRWFEYVGFWGCAILFISGLFALKDLKLGSVLGCVGFVMTMFYLGPALANILHGMIVGNLVLKAPQIAALVLIIGLPLIAIVRLIWNLKTISLRRAEQAHH